jgi:N-acetylglucosamine kinase-like BadF-type ATPase
VVGCFGATAGAPGVLVIAGTGAVGIAIDARGGHTVRGGFGPFLGGDPGSAFWMASQAVIAAQDEPDLAAAICEHFEVAVLTDLIPLLYSGGFDATRLAGLSEVLSRNPCAAWLRIESRAGRELAELAGPLGAFAGGPSAPVFGSGSVLLSNHRVRESLEQELGRSVEAPRLDAACGAALLAFRETGTLVTASLIERMRGEV